MVNWSVEAVESALCALRQERGNTTGLEIRPSIGTDTVFVGATLCAFANMPDGGTIILGVEPGSDYAVVGVDEPAQIVRQLRETAASSVVPAPHLTCRALKISGKTVLVADVVPLPLDEKPARSRGQAYLRQADGNAQMQPYELRMIEALKAESTRPAFSDKSPVPGLSVEDLDSVLLSRYLAEVREENPHWVEVPEAMILRQTGVILADGTLTLAGLYSMGMNPQGEFPGLSVYGESKSLASLRNDETRFIQRFAGPIPVLVQRILEWIDKVQTASRRSTARAKAERPNHIPTEALREILTNALIHRNLGVHALAAGQSVRVIVGHAGVTIWNPGGLKNISLEQLRSETSHPTPVNQHLYAIVRRQRLSDGSQLIRGEGRGLRATHRACVRAGILPPSLDDAGVHFTASLWNPAAPSRPAPRRGKSALNGESMTRPFTRNQTQIERALRTSGELGIQALAHQTDLKLGSLRYALDILIEAGAVIRHGGQGERSTTYEWNSQWRTGAG